MKYIILISLLIISSISYSLEDDLEKTIAIAGNGARIQSERLKIVSENLANESTTGSLPGEEGYKRKIILVKNKYDPILKANKLVIDKHTTSHDPFILKYDPYHPAADEQGYVKYPNIHKEIEKADSLEAQRSYEANINVIEISNQMIQKTLEALK